MSAAELQQANYAAIEKARFEAERDKKVKKIRELAKWGHNISKLKADFEGAWQHEYLFICLCNCHLFIYYYIL